MKNENSAGGVIVAFNRETFYVLLLQDKKGNWTFPKGLIEKGEDTEETAIREISEEVGIKNLKLIRKLSSVHYLYKWEGKLISKTVYYYLFQNGGNEKLVPQREEGILDVKWWKWEEALNIIGYRKTNLKLLKETESIIKI